MRVAESTEDRREDLAGGKVAQTQGAVLEGKEGR